MLTFGSVKELREADYIVNVAGSIKKEIMSQGEKADYNRVKRYMLDKWQYWYLRVNIMLSTSIHSLEMNLVR